MRLGPASGQTGEGIDKPAPLDAELSYVVPDGDTPRLSAMNGPLNNEPFYVEISSVHDSPR